MITVSISAIAQCVSLLRFRQEAQIEIAFFNQRMIIINWTGLIKFIRTCLSHSEWAQEKSKWARIMTRIMIYTLFYIRNWSADGMMCFCILSILNWILHLSKSCVAHSVNRFCLIFTMLISHQGDFKPVEYSLFIVCHYLLAWRGYNFTRGGGSSFFLLPIGGFIIFF